MHYICTDKMGTNEGWPEAFGFSISGGSPVVISEVEEGGSAQQAGLQPGDALIELDGVCVEEWSRIEVVDHARCASKVPPSLVVMSRVRQFSIPRDEEGGYGLTFRGSSPVFVRSVDYPSSARTAGVRSGDLLLEVNWENVRFCSKSQVLERVKSSGRVLHLMVVAGGLGTTPRSPLHSADISTFMGARAVGGADKKTLEMRTNKAKIFHSKVNYYLMDDDQKKTHLLTLLRLYSKDRDIDSLGHSLDVLLDTPIQRRLLPHIRSFVLSSHHKRFDVLMSYSPDRAAPSSRRGSYDLGSHHSRPLSMTRSSPWRSSLPNLATGGERVVCVDRGSGGFGFTLSGNCPVFIRSVDPGGAASRMGLRPGDRILKLNGLDIRNSTHSHVVRLLRGSGTRPTLVVASLESLEGSVRSTAPHPRGGGGVRKNTEAFKDKMEQVLGEDDRQSVIETLGKFSKDQNLQDLVEGLGDVLNDRNKVVLFHYICQLLPGEAQNEFDRIAAGMLTGGGTSKASKERHALIRGAMGTNGASHDLLHMSHDGELQDTFIGSGKGTTKSSSLTIGSPGSRVVQQLRKEKKDPQGADKSSSSNGMPNTSVYSTPGGTPLPPNPPPTPHIGVGGIPIPPPPPPTLPGRHGQTNKLKRVNWEKVQGTEGTIWSELSGLEDALEYFELEKQFASGKPKVTSGQGKKKQPTVLDPRKAYNISILLGHLKLPFDKIKEAVLKCDESVLSEQHLRQLEAFAPDKTECLGFTRYYDNPEVLSIPDRFSCEMSTIPCYQERVKAMVFKLHFIDKVEEIKPDLEAISIAAIQLQSSKHLKKVLEIVLAVGNYMNAGNHRVGGASGFKISYLAQLKDLRTTDNKSSLVHFVAGTAERKFPDTLEFPNDLSFIRKAARVSGQTLEVEMNELSQGLKVIQRDILEISSREKMDDDHFEETMKPFLVEADKEMDSLLKLYGKMKTEYQAAVRFFGEDPLKLRIDDFFGAFATFVDDFERAAQENKAERERVVLLERKLQERATEVPGKKRGSLSKLFGRTKDKDVDLRHELEAKTQQSKSIDFSALEKKKDVELVEPEQHDFRHLLRQTDHSKQPAVQSGAWPQPPETRQTGQTGYRQPSIDKLRDNEEQVSTNGKQDYDHETLF